MIIYMIQTVQLIVLKHGEERARKIAECGQFNQMEDGTPYLVITDEEKWTNLQNVNN